MLTSAQVWYDVNMSPNEETVSLKSFDGYTVYPWIISILLVSLASIAAAAISRKLGRIVALSIGFAASAALVALTATALVKTDLLAVSKQIELATGIAATHGISNVSVSTLLPAYVALGAFFLLMLCFGLALISQRSWAERAASPRTQADKASKTTSPTDSIGLWDDQR